MVYYNTAVVISFGSLVSRVFLSASTVEKQIYLREKAKTPKDKNDELKGGAEPNARKASTRGAPDHHRRNYYNYHNCAYSAYCVLCHPGSVTSPGNKLAIHTCTHPHIHTHCIATPRTAVLYSKNRYCTPRCSTTRANICRKAMERDFGSCHGQDDSTAPLKCDDHTPR